jgi:hypothetical protein
MYRSKVIVSAAPPVADSINEPSETEAPIAPLNPAPLPTPPEPPAVATTAPPKAEQTQKRSKKEMERALRRGQITEVLPDTTTTIDATNQHEFRLPDPIAANHHPDGIPSVKNAVTVMYDPSVGAAVSGKMGKSGKNQINQLLKSAVALERQRAEQQQISHVSSANTHRANAKRKYGW